MGVVKAPRFGWGGLSTRAPDTGLPLLECTVLNDLRVVGMDLIQRLGCVRVGQVTGTAKAMDFNGSTQYLSNVVDSRVWALGTQFTLELAVAADTLANDEAVLTVGSTTPCITVDLASSKWRVRIVDSADTTDTLTSTTDASTTGTDTLQIVRDGTSLTLRLNNVSEDTDTAHATNSLKTPVGDLRIGRSGGADYYDGTVDYVRVMSIAKSNHNDRLVRLPNPRAKHVLGDYDFNGTGTLVYDRSRYENHLIAANAPTEVTSLCHNPVPVRALAMMVNTITNKKELLMAAGGQYYLAGVD